MNSRIMDIQETHTYKTLKNDNDLIFQDNIGGYIFCKPVEINDDIKMRIIRLDILRKQHKPEYRNIWNKGTVNWFKFNHENFTYLI